MKNLAKMTILAFSCMMLISSNAVADKKANQVAIGAAVAHNKHNHKNNKRLSEERAEADYDRGYNDALYSSHYDTSGASDAYRSGYDAGEYERGNRVSHNRNHREHNGHGEAPSLARRACVGESNPEKWVVMITLSKWLQVISTQSAKSVVRAMSICWRLAEFRASFP